MALVLDFDADRGEKYCLTSKRRPRLLDSNLAIVQYRVLITGFHCWKDSAQSPNVNNNRVGRTVRIWTLPRSAVRERKQHKFNLPSRIMRQWFAVSTNATLNMSWTQFINHANYKIIDVNVWTLQTSQNYILPHLWNGITPWGACPVQKQFHDREWRAIQNHCWHQGRCLRPLFNTASSFSSLLFVNKTAVDHQMPLIAITVVSDTLFLELHEMRGFSIIIFRD